MIKGGRARAAERGKKCPFLHACKVYLLFGFWLGGFLSLGRVKGAAPSPLLLPPTLWSLRLECPWHGPGPRQTPSSSNSMRDHACCWRSPSPQPTHPPTPRASRTGGKGHGWRRDQGRGAGRGGVDSLVHTQPTHDEAASAGGGMTFCVCERWPPTPPTHPLSTRLQTPTTAPLPTVHDEARWGLPLRGPGVVPRGWGWRNNPFVSWVL